MSYNMRQTDSSFYMHKYHISKAVAAIQELKGKKSSGFAWVDKDFHKHSDFKDIMSEWRYAVLFNNNGDVDEIEFLGEKFGDDRVLFDAIAPYVKEESYIQMQGEDGQIWRWVFDGEKCTEKLGTVVFD